MEDLQHFVSDLVRLWNLHEHRENLYKQAMTLESLNPLRRVCSQGFMVSLLFKKEIMWIYDQFKSTLDDGDILHCKTRHNLPTIIFASQDIASITDMLLEQESKTIRLYKALLANDHLTHDTSQILTEHLHKLNDINLNLKNQVPQNPPIHYLIQNAVA